MTVFWGEIEDCHLLPESTRDVAKRSIFTSFFFFNVFQSSTSSLQSAFQGQPSESMIFLAPPVLIFE